MSKTYLAVVTCAGATVLAGCQNAEIVRRSTAKRAGERYPSAGEMVADIDRARLAVSGASPRRWWQ